jgi:hypothetical protein
MLPLLYHFYHYAEAYAFLCVWIVTPLSYYFLFSLLYSYLSEVKKDA